MGLNLIAGCHTHRERVWFYRGRLEGLESFYRAHWRCRGLIVSDDQSEAGEALSDYADVGYRHGAYRPDGDLETVNTYSTTKAPTRAARADTGTTAGTATSSAARQ